MHQPLRHTQPCVPCGRRLSTLLKAKSGREGRRWRPLCQLEEKLDQVARSINQVAGVFHFVVERESHARPPAAAAPARRAAVRDAGARGGVTQESERTDRERVCERARRGESVHSRCSLTLTLSALKIQPRSICSPATRATRTQTYTETVTDTHSHRNSHTRHLYTTLRILH